MLYGAQTDTRRCATPEGRDAEIDDCLRARALKAAGADHERPARR